MMFTKARGVRVGRRSEQPWKLTAKKKAYPTQLTTTEALPGCSPTHLLGTQNNTKLFSSSVPKMCRLMMDFLLGCRPAYSSTIPRTPQRALSIFIPLVSERNGSLIISHAFFEAVTMELEGSLGFSLSLVCARSLNPTRMAFSENLRWKVFANFRSPAMTTTSGIWYSSLTWLNRAEAFLRHQRRPKLNLIKYSTTTFCCTKQLFPPPCCSLDSVRAKKWV